ncbi:AEC family transporter [Azotobacter beijerinckii]|uniref:AEC family transporter n=1 Tax=Azotobacter beijerinckii TaxID=170623 RepID=UPI002952CFBF|nr:AEC family transporter [Azotobacter beijerinckii]MDV7211972.1 AEC family transporter [Azotobacter beijerinckii]
MLQILSITMPIFILIGLGFFAVRFEVISREQVRGLGSFVITFALPALVLKAVSDSPFQEVMNWQYLLAYCAGSLIVYLLGLLFALRVRREPLDTGAISALGMAVSNSGFVGYPIVAMLLGPAAAIGLALNMLVEHLLIIPLSLTLAEAGRQQGSTGKVLRETARRLARTPLIIAMLVGLLLSLLEARLPAIPGKVVDMLASASAPVALFVIGGSLYGLKLHGLFAELRMIAVGKLLLHPLAVFLLFSLLPDVDPVLMVAGVLFASAPMLSVYPIFGQRFGVEGRCAAALLFTTLMSFFSISLLIGIMKPHL